jgi:hypothetical protein
MRRALLSLPLAALLLPASAGAAYRPAAEVTLDRTTPLSAPAITSIMHLPSGDDTTRTITARFPPAFTYNPAFSVTGCTPEQASTYTCPEATRLGSATVVSPFGNGEGTVNLTTDFRLVILFQSLGGVYRQRVYGTIRVLDDGSFELAFEDLPQIPITESRIALDGGPRGQLATPRRCGTYDITTGFVSHAGAVVEQKVPVAITGCPAPLRVLSARASGARVSWALQGPATGTEVTLYRWASGGWDEVSSATLPATRTSWRRPRGKGRYLVTLRALGAGGGASPATRIRV